MASYVPGKCNIGPWNRKLRFAFGAAFLLLSLFIFLATSGLPKYYRLGLIVPLFLGYLGILEGLLSFCVMHGLRGTRDLR